jgi:Transglutaminase-like superfamily
MWAPENTPPAFGRACRDELSMQCLDARGRCYHLPPHVYACRTDSGVVFLDTRRGRYFGVGGKHFAQLADRVVDLLGCVPPHGDGPDQTISVEPVEGMARQLIKAGLLCPGAGEGLRSNSRSVPPPDRELPYSVYPGGVSLRAIDLVHFLSACGKAAWYLRCCSLESITARVSAARRARDGFDVGRSLRLVQRFQMLRSWTFTEKDQCLFNALSLIFFLQHYGSFPYFVIGVKATPFAAHSWVQRDRLVLDGSPANVAHFVPILVA